MEKIRVGIFGAGPRGRSLIKPFMLLNCDIVAICDNREKELARAAEMIGGDVATYQDFDSFVDHEMDAVILANFFHEHAPYAIKCFERGLHVFSECISNGTMAEGVELVEAFEKSKSIYMLAENYPQMKFNREMKRVCDSGTLGKIVYAEGEYNHPGSPWNSDFAKEYNYFDGHWRRRLPRTYYITHSLGPIMRATGATPKRVTAFSSFAPAEGDIPVGGFVGDVTAVVLTQNDDGSIFRVTGCSMYGGHHNAYRICGKRGQIENLRGMGEQIMLRYNEWDLPEGAEEINLYTPTWNDPDEEFINQSGHGGSDYLTARMFIDCIRKGVQPEHPFDIYSAVAMSSVAILSFRSVMEGGAPYDIPDFRNKEDAEKYRNDRATPFYSKGNEPTIPCCSHSDYSPTEKQIALFRESLNK